MPPSTPSDSALLDWTLIRSFVAVMQAGNLTQAAARLGLTQPTLGRHIREIERIAGETLFDRLPGGLRPTARAAALFERAEAMDAAAGAFGRALGGDPGRLSGTVRLTASEVFGSAVLPPILARFAARHPEVELELAVSNAQDNLLRREADIAVRHARPDQPDLVAVRVGTARIGFFAHESYLAARGRPERFADLTAHRLVGPDRSDVAIRSAAARGIRIDRHAFAFRTDALLAQMAAVEAGLGIGACHIGLAAGRPGLVRVLPDAFEEALEVWVAAHDDLHRSRRLRALFDHLVAELRTALRSAEPAPGPSPRPDGPSAP